MEEDAAASFEKPAAAPLYLCAAWRARTVELEPSETFVGVVQIASALKVVSLPLVLFIETTHWSSASPVDVPIADVLMVTPVLVEGVSPPPPVTNIPAGQVANAFCCVPFGKAVSAEMA